MRTIRPASEEEMVLAFVQAESASPVHRHKYERLLERGPIPLDALIDQADLHDERQNAERRRLLTATRGYDRRTLLFASFPQDVAWGYAFLEPADMAALRYLNDASWVGMSGGSRRVSDGAARAAAHGGVADIVAGLRNGRTYPPLILVEADGALVVLEGNTRATAFVRANYSGEVACLIGCSPAMGGWAFA